VASPLGGVFLAKWDSVHFGGNVIKLPMIGSPHSRCMTCRPKGMGLEVAMYTYRRGSTKGRVEASKSYLYRGGTSILSRHSYYLSCRNMS